MSFPSLMSLENRLEYYCNRKSEYLFDGEDLILNDSQSTEILGEFLVKMNENEKNVLTAEKKEIKQFINLKKTDYIGGSLLGGGTIGGTAGTLGGLVTSEILAVSLKLGLAAVVAGSTSVALAIATPISASLFLKLRENAREEKLKQISKEITNKRIERLREKINIISEKKSLTQDLEELNQLKKAEYYFEITLNRALRFRSNAKSNEVVYHGFMQTEYKKNK